MHVTRVVIQEHVLIKQVMHLLDRSRQILGQYVGCGELAPQSGRCRSCSGETGPD